MWFNQLHLTEQPEPEGGQKHLWTFPQESPFRNVSKTRTMNVTIHFNFLETASNSLLQKSEYVDRNSIRILFLESHSPALILWKSPYSSFRTGNFGRRYLALTIPGKPTAELFSRQQLSSSTDQKLSCKMLLNLQDISLWFTHFQWLFIHWNRRPETQALEQRLALKQRPQKLTWWCWRAFLTYSHYDWIFSICLITRRMRPG